MYLEEYTIGMEWKTEPVTISREELLDFTMKYDPHPIHFDDEYAKNTRFKEIIAPGVLTYMAVWGPFMKLNPFAYILDGYRDAILYGRDFAANLDAALIFWAITIVMFLVSCVVHMRFRHKFIDLL